MATISVIVPVYKVEPYLRRCVDSILAQTYTDFELILVDDGSPDNCGKICDEYAAKDNRVKVIHQANGGLSAARNAGIDWATNNSDSRYITFVDSDDWIVETCLSRLHEGVLLGSEISIVGLARAYDETTIVCLHPDHGWKVLPVEEYWLTPDESKECSVTKLYTKTLFNNIRFPVGRVSEEVFTTHKLVFAAKHIAIRGGAYYMYLYRAESITTQAGEEHKRDLVEAGWAQYEFIRDKGFARAAEFSRGRACLFMLNVAEAVRKSNPKFSGDLTQRIETTLKEQPLSFWDNRTVYRHLQPWRFWLQWPFSMMWNLICHGRSSWLLQDLPPILKMLSIERKRKHL